MLRNIGLVPPRARRIARVVEAIGTGALTGGGALLTACSDGASAPASVETSNLRPEGPRLTVASTSVTTAVLYPTIDNVYVSTEGHRLVIPAYSICNVATSGYGVGQWDKPCTPATSPIVFTITSTVDAKGNPRVSVSPDVRFSPTKTVTAIFADTVAAKALAPLIKYCPGNGSGCVDESKTDPSLRTYTNPATKQVYRRIKHFSGYTVIVGLDCENSETGCPSLDRASLAARASGYITTTGLDGGSTLDKNDENNDDR